MTGGVATDADVDDGESGLESCDMIYGSVMVMSRACC